MYIAQVTCITKPTHQTSILQKTALQSMFKIKWILAPIWFYFGMALGPKSDPNLYKIAFNIAAQDEHPKDSLSDRLQIVVWSLLGSILGPRSAQDLPFWIQDRLQTANFGAKIGPRPPTWSQDGPKTLSRHLRRPILEDLGPILMDFLSSKPSKI